MDRCREASFAFKQNYAHQPRRAYVPQTNNESLRSERSRSPSQRLPDGEGDPWLLTARLAALHVLKGGTTIRVDSIGGRRLQVGPTVTTHPTSSCNIDRGNDVFTPAAESFGTLTPASVSNREPCSLRYPSVYEDTIAPLADKLAGLRTEV